MQIQFRINILYIICHDYFYRIDYSNQRSNLYHRLLARTDVISALLLHPVRQSLLQQVLYPFFDLIYLLKSSILMLNLSLYSAHSILSLKDPQIYL